jgi:hypothetical protein
LLELTQVVRKLFEGVNGVRGVSVTFKDDEVEVVVFIECDRWNESRMVELLYAENAVMQRFPGIRFTFKTVWLGDK